MQKEAVTHAVQRLASKSGTKITHAIQFSQTKWTRWEKMESRLGCPDWHAAMRSLRWQKLPQIYCPGHATVRRNERASRLASAADIAIGLQPGMAEMLRGLRNILNSDNRASQNWLPRRRRGREGTTDWHSPRSGTMCQTRSTLVLAALKGKRAGGKREGEGGGGEEEEGARRQNGARMDLSERYCAAFSVNCSLFRTPGLSEGHHQAGPRVVSKWGHQRWARTVGCG